MENALVREHLKKRQIANRCICPEIRAECERSITAASQIGGWTGSELSKVKNIYREFFAKKSSLLLPNEDVYTSHTEIFNYLRENERMLSDHWIWFASYARGHHATIVTSNDAFDDIGSRFQIPIDSWTQ